MRFQSQLQKQQKKLRGSIGYLTIFETSEKYQSNWIISPGRDETKKSLTHSSKIFQFVRLQIF